MQEFDTAHLIYLVMLGTAVVFWFIVQNRNSLGKVAQQALLWGLIFMGVIAGIGMWDHIKQTVLPRQSVELANGRIVAPLAADGHYYLSAEVNGVPIRFVVDTGATDLVLTQRDAERAGYDLDKISFHGSARTANGIIRTAPIRLDSIDIGGIRDENVRAVVNGGELDSSLLGMSYLSRFGTVTFADGKLILTR
ncbi:TIGR02281 family clan AA aspartic protease [Roseovarius nubinhibens]|jgi:aspartyl protease family protein|uniref:retropepsin-like aspartic protease family protein n=1 Tax=Roseovarius nubinhibens TaxID=314263 RepID=UPI001C095BB0|nr:TIGR02281 family clan AA aspartic protease [Roseovarius nubinhibens]MBU3001184.1 TIGR02281 family clan AA aspartic protease [Roseovarius nubinhibens]